MSRNYWTPEQEEKLLATVDMLRGAVPSTVRVECRGCKACRAYKIEFAHFDVGGESLGDFYIVSRREDGSVARRFTRRAEAEEFVRLQVAGRFHDD
jgi:hypothetical protein